MTTNPMTYKPKKFAFTRNDEAEVARTLVHRSIVESDAGIPLFSMHETALVASACAISHVFAGCKVEWDQNGPILCDEDNNKSALIIPVGAGHRKTAPPINTYINVLASVAPDPAMIGVTYDSMVFTAISAKHDRKDKMAVWILGSISSKRFANICVPHKHPEIMASVTAGQLDPVDQVIR